MKDGQQWVHIRGNIYLALLKPLKLEGNPKKPIPTFKNTPDMVCIENLLSHVSAGKIQIDDQNHENIKFKKEYIPKLFLQNMLLNTLHTLIFQSSKKFLNY